MSFVILKYAAVSCIALCVSIGVALYPAHRRIVFKCRRAAGGLRGGTDDGPSCIQVVNRLF